MVLDADPVGIFERMKAICRACGVINLAPLENQIRLEGLRPGKPLLEAIVHTAVSLMNQAEAAVFCLGGGRRGPEMLLCRHRFGS